MHHLYLITNLVNWKTYVGITTNPRLRWTKHKYGHGSRLVRLAIAKYGIENFRFAVIFKSPDRACVEWMERHAISDWKTESPLGYNRNPGGGGPPVGLKHSAETVARRAAANRGKKREPGFGKRMSAVNKGRKRTPEVRQRWSESRRGHPAYPRQQETASRLHSRPVSVEGIAYPSLKLASARTGLSYSSLKKRFRRYAESNSFPTGWAYLS